MPYTYPYPRPAVTVDCIILSPKGNSYQVLLIERGKEPFKNTWALPGGFVDENESLEVAAARELAEETTLTGVAMVQLKAFGNPGRDPRGHTVSVVFYGVTDAQTAQIKGSDDATQARWFDIAQLPAMAFDHAQIMEFAIKTLQLR